MVEKGFTPRFGYYNYSAWASDFEKQSVGGNDYIYADSCDFVYFAGHGWTDHFAFGGNHDGDGAYPFKAYSTFGSAEVDWGDQDMEWIFISASHSLEEFPYEWDPAFHSPITLGKVLIPGAILCCLPRKAASPYIRLGGMRLSNGRSPDTAEPCILCTSYILPLNQLYIIGTSIYLG
jgi:hypothetical protein